MSDYTEHTLDLQINSYFDLYQILLTGKHFNCLKDCKTTETISSFKKMPSSGKCNLEDASKMLKGSGTKLYISD